VEDRQKLNRWRLALGRYSESSLGSFTDRESMSMGEALDFLYNREYTDERDIYEGRQGGRQDSILSLPKWLDTVHELFPNSVAEKIEAHALDRYELTGLLTDARVLEKLEPNMALLKQVLALKGSMSPDVLPIARKAVERVVSDLKKKMEQNVRNAIVGKRDPLRASPLKIAKNFDFKKTVKKNLKNYSESHNGIIIQKAYFYANVKSFNPYHIIILVDESGSMLSSAIHSAVMASIFSSLPSISAKLVIFDTSIVDLSGYIDDPVEALMRVTLGGGTDIGLALAYGESLIEYPQKTIVILVSDLYEGSGYQRMYAAAKSIIDCGARLFALTSLDYEASQGSYDKAAAKRFAGLGAKVAALTPDHLAEWVGSVLSGGRA